MVFLTDKEIDWLNVNFPRLTYDQISNSISGRIGIDMHYLDNPVIKDSYNVRIDMASMTTRNELPDVYNTDNRIINVAKKKGKPIADFHIDGNGKLCMMFPLKFSKFYPNGFEIAPFMTHLSSHLYWVSYYELYNKEPWRGEFHGNVAMLDYFSDPSNYDLILKNKQQLEMVRSYYKRMKGKGIALSKLRNLLKEPSFVKELFKDIRL